MSQHTLHVIVMIVTGGSFVLRMRLHRNKFFLVLAGGLGAYIAYYQAWLAGWI